MKRVKGLNLLKGTLCNYFYNEWWWWQWQQSKLMLKINDGDDMWKNAVDLSWPDKNYNVLSITSNHYLSQCVKFGFSCINEMKGYSNCKFQILQLLRLTHDFPAIWCRKQKTKIEFQIYSQVYILIYMLANVLVANYHKWYQKLYQSEKTISEETFWNCAKNMKVLQLIYRSRLPCFYNKLRETLEKENNVLSSCRHIHTRKYAYAIIMYICIYLVSPWTPCKAFS